MKPLQLAAVSLLAVTALGLSACSKSADDPADPAASASPSPPVADQAGHDMAVGCAANLKAVGDIYRSIASVKSGSDAAELTTTADARDAASTLYRSKAVETGKALGKVEATVNADVDAKLASVNAGSSGDFEAFATGVAAEADKCPPPV